MPIMVRICGFEASGQRVDGTLLQTVVGTPGYTAPEIWGPLPYNEEGSVYTNSVDIWSLGCLTYVMLTKDAPFTDTQGLLDYIQGRTSLPKTKLIEKSASVTVVKFIASLMVLLPGDRLTADQALKLPWVTTGGEEE